MSSPRFIRFALAFTLVVAFHLGASAPVSGQVAGPNSPGTAVDDATIGTVVWAAPGNVAANDSILATAGVMGTAQTHYIKATNFGFSIPPTAVIAGIEVRVDKRSVANTPLDNAIRIVKGGTIGTTDRSNVAPWPIPETVVIYGGASDLWGLTWTAADINNTGFGTAVSAKGNGALDTAAVDHITIRVFYAVCGDTTLGPGEQCDDGNTQNGDCCSSTCQFETSAVLCRGVSTGEVCDEEEFCTGASGTCPADGVKPNTEECRTAASECDAAEFCDGVGKNCPADVFAPDGTPCTDEGQVCTVDECDGAGNCEHSPTATCNTIPGRIIVVKPAKLSKFVSKGSFLLPDSMDAPTVEGGSLRFFDTTAPGAGDVTYNLPALKWKALGNPPGSRGFKYKGEGSMTDPCKVVLVKPKVIKGVCKGPGVTLTPPFAGNGGVILEVGSGTTHYCAEFVPPDVRNTATVFKRKNAPAPPACPQVSGPVPPTPTATNTAAGPTNTPTLTRTPTVTSTPGGLGDHKCTLDESPTTCIGGANNGNACTAPSDCPMGTCQHESRLEVNAFVVVPITVPANISGAIDLSCGGIDGGTGKAPCSCNIQEFDPIPLPPIGTVCVTPGAPCPAREIDCDGGNALGVEMTSDGNIGACTGNADCSTQCDTFCAPDVQFDSGCTGFCEGGSNDGNDCNNESDCPSGACNGPDPVGANDDICQCTCLDNAAFGPSAAGDLQCNLSANIVIEDAAPCDGTDVAINIGSTCIPLSSQRASTFIDDANFGTAPDFGPHSNTGSPIDCSTLQTSTTTGLDLAGVANFFGSALGDLAVEIFAQCQ